jgi:predicted nuclease with TOPRIM domain
VPVDDRSHLDLQRRLEEVLVAREAEILMDHFGDISARFDEVDARFDRVDARLDRLDARLDRLDARLAEVDTRLDRIDTRMEMLDGRMALLEKHFSVFSQRFDAKIEGLFARQGWRLMGMMIALVAVLLAGVGVLG